MKTILKLFLSIFLLHVVITAQVKEDSLKLNLNQVTITATRYPELIRELPLAVDIIPSFDLKSVRPFGFDQALMTVPGVMAQSRAGGQDVRLTIRGFGARGAGDRSNAGTSRGIRIMVDGIPETEPDGRTSFDNIEMGFADNVEVIRSNASALWGNGSGGVVNISTFNDFTSPFADLQFTTGSYKLNKYFFRAGMQLGSGKLIAGFSNTKTEGYRAHSASARTNMIVDIVSPLSPKSRLGVFLSGTSSLFHIPGPLTLAEFNADPAQANSDYLKRDERRYNRLGRIGVSFDYDFCKSNSIAFTMYANPKYLQRSERSTFRDFTRYHVGGSLLYHNTMTFNSGLKNIFTVGLDEAYQDGAILFYSLSASNGRGTTLKDNKAEGANILGAFLQDEFIFNDQLSVLAGLRYDKISYYSESYFDPALLPETKRFEKITPKIGISYKLYNDIQLYANLGGGVEVPAGNETDPYPGAPAGLMINPLLEPITSTTIEAGSKGAVQFSNAAFLTGVEYTFAAYMVKVKNEIIPYNSGKFYMTVGSATRSGVELSAKLFAVYGLSLNAALTLSSNKYDSYTVDSSYFGKTTKAVYDNNKIAGIPSSGLNLGLQYKPDFAPGLTITANQQSLSEYYADDANRYSVPSYLIINAGVSYEGVISHLKNLGYRASFNAYNLTDKKYASSAFVNPDLRAGAPVYLEPGLPRNFVFSIGVML